MRQVTVTGVAERAVVMGRRPYSVLVHPDAQHTGLIDADCDRGKADLWTEAERIWLEGFCPLSR
ncbi:hypothetical protein E2C06_32295 [Dankookia rubra]|uniref:Uncharacterized protein n=1 Tax=Dankookia rubra TaxID=1442381 RepID=A0A4R5Q7S5_9PROT|nr:hypothetical protein [Dankookia rubra]TDH58498.1 hypothetical protein E2C06_32295 [Dankookia rubra]